MTPVEHLEELLLRCDEREWDQMTSSLFVGIQASGFPLGEDPGPFLVRNLLGIDYETGAMAASAAVGEGQGIQFHLRDRESSAEDLFSRLREYRDQHGARNVAGALLFSCLGRGECLYGDLGHDSRVFREILGEVPMGGFFGHGEIGPVGGITHVHGYTSAFALFRPAE